MSASLRTDTYPMVYSNHRVLRNLATEIIFMANKQTVKQNDNERLTWFGNGTKLGCFGTDYFRFDATTTTSIGKTERWSVNCTNQLIHIHAHVTNIFTVMKGTQSHFLMRALKIRKSRPTQHDKTKLNFRIKIKLKIGSINIFLWAVELSHTAEACILRVLILGIYTVLQKISKNICNVYCEAGLKSQL